MKCPIHPHEFPQLRIQLHGEVSLKRNVQRLPAQSAESELDAA